MSANGLLVAMVAGSALVIGLGARRSEPAAPAAPPTPVREEPWLSREAAAQLIGDSGPGPLFDHLFLGGMPPAPEDRALIAEFARKNNVEIHLDVEGGELVAIRIAVEYGGCCGYEGADVLALRLGRPSTGTCCGCGNETWIDDWATVNDTGIRTRASVRVNRISVRWERTATPEQLVERADALLGMETSKVASKAGDRWRAVAFQNYQLEVPFPFPGRGDWGRSPSLDLRDDLAMRVQSERGKIVTVSFPIYGNGYGDEPEDESGGIAAALRARWGRPRVVDGVSTWRSGDKTITLEGDAMLTLTLTLRS